MVPPMAMATYLQMVSADELAALEKDTSGKKVAEAGAAVVSYTT